MQSSQSIQNSYNMQIPQFIQSYANIEYSKVKQRGRCGAHTLNGTRTGESTQLTLLISSLLRRSLIEIS